MRKLFKIKKVADVGIFFYCFQKKKVKCWRRNFGVNRKNIIRICFSFTKKTVFFLKKIFNFKTDFKLQFFNLE